MTDILVATMLTLAVAVGWFGVLRLTRSVRHTSLTAAAAWAVWFQVTLTITTIATLCQSRVLPGILDQLWYLTAVSALCPFVAVLGARRSRLLEWSLFIVLPLILVLEWPALAQLARCWKGQRLELEMPAFYGYCLVLLMAVGNFLLTRFAFASLMWMVLWDWELTQLLESPDERLASRFFPATVLVVVWINAFRSARRSYMKPSWNRVWSDFRDAFGVVWATRIAARMNEIARREQWPWTLAVDGLRPNTMGTTVPCDPIADPRVDQTFRWLLKPFVDPEWIDERLTASTDRASGG